MEKGTIGFLVWLAVTLLVGVTVFCGHLALTATVREDIISGTVAFLGFGAGTLWAFTELGKKA